MINWNKNLLSEKFKKKIDETLVSVDKKISTKKKDDSSKKEQTSKKNKSSSSLKKLKEDLTEKIVELTILDNLTKQYNIFIEIIDKLSIKDLEDLKNKFSI